jgi:hypothetical protein
MVDAESRVMVVVGRESVVIVSTVDGDAQGKHGRRQGVGSTGISTGIGVVVGVGGDGVEHADLDAVDGSL